MTKYIKIHQNTLQSGLIKWLKWLGFTCANCGGYANSLRKLSQRDTSHTLRERAHTHRDANAVTRHMESYLLYKSIISQKEKNMLLSSTDSVPLQNWLNHVEHWISNQWFCGNILRAASFHRYCTDCPNLPLYLEKLLMDLAKLRVPICKPHSLK